MNISQVHGRTYNFFILRILTYFDGLITNIKIKFAPMFTKILVTSTSKYLSMRSYEKKNQKNHSSDLFGSTANTLRYCMKSFHIFTRRELPRYQNTEHYGDFISRQPMLFEHGSRDFEAISHVPLSRNTLFFYIQLAVSRRKMYEMI